MLLPPVGATGVVGVVGVAVPHAYGLLHVLTGVYDCGFGAIQVESTDVLLH